MKKLILSVLLVFIILSQGVLAQSNCSSQIVNKIKPSPCEAKNNTMMIKMNQSFLSMIKMNDIMMNNNCEKKHLKLNINLMITMNKKLTNMIKMNNKMILSDRKKLMAAKK